MHDLYTRVVLCDLGSDTVLMSAGQKASQALLCQNIKVIVAGSCSAEIYYLESQQFCCA